MRYEKQMAVPVFGAAGQRRLSKAKIAIVGAGALGCFSAQYLVRMGAKEVRIADGDVVSLTNLHRQTLFTEADAFRRLKKAKVAAQRLARVNSEVKVVALPEFIDSENIGDFTKDVDLILDATDSMPARFLVNDFAVKHNIPWVYTGVAGKEGGILPVIPRKGPCLRCLFPEEPETVRNCKTDGILPLTPAMAVPMQVAQALQILQGSVVPGTFIRFDVWSGVSRVLHLKRSENCPVCGK